MKSIMEVRVECITCGWIGMVGDCEPDIDGEGSLGCPECCSIIAIEGGK